MCIYVTKGRDTYVAIQTDGHNSGTIKKEVE